MSRKKVNLTGIKKEKLTAINPLDKRLNKSIVWLCKCDCGNYCEVSADKFGRTKSCGCSRVKVYKKSNKKSNYSRKDGGNRLSKYLVDNTNLLLIMNKTLSKANRSGTIGVHYNKNRWCAKITCQGKIYHLGRFEDKDDAIKLRKEAEEKIFKPIIDKYKDQLK